MTVRLKLAIRRCAWHRKYQGRAKWMGVTWWRGIGVTFTDGMCADCARRARGEFRVPRSPIAPSARYVEGMVRDGARGANGGPA
jgi:hypothetical protein